jgi:hypothetical protein
MIATPRQKDIRMAKPKPATASLMPRDGFDTDGMEDLFDVTAIDAIATETGDKIEVSIGEAADMLGISKRSVYRRIKDGNLASRSDESGTYVTVPLRHDKRVHIAKSDADDKLAKLESLLAKVEQERDLAKDKAVYLQGQVDVYEKQFKLLTDRYHGQGWWSRLCSWFNR